MSKIKAYCQICGKERFLWLSELKKNKTGIVCSKECNKIRASKWAKKTGLGDEIRTNQSGENHWNWQGKTRNQVCDNCGKIFYRKVHSYKRKFCSIQCVGEYYSGEKHYCWENGKSFEPYGIAFNNGLKEIIRKRDNYKCTECGIDQSLEKLIVHHKDKNKTNNDKENLVSVCRSCHAKIHQSFRRKHEEISSSTNI